MKQFTNISDQELRSLLNQMLLSESESGINPSKLFEMETSIILKNAPIHAVNLTIGATLLSKLKAKILYKMALKWLISLSIVTATSTTVYFGLNQAEKPKQFNSKTTATAVKTTNEDSLAKEDATPIFSSVTAKSSMQNSFFLPFKSAITEIQQQQQHELQKPSVFNQELVHQETYNEINLISIESCAAKIVVVGSSNQQKVSLKTNIDDTINNRELAKYIKIETTTVNGVLTINVSNKIKSTVKMFSKIQETMMAELYLEVPEKVNLKISNNAGNTDISGMVNEYININNDYGNLKLVNIKTIAKYDVESGNIDIKNHVGELNVDCEYGNITLNECQGNIHSKIESGTFKSTETNGDIDLRNQYGNVSIKAAKGNRLDSKIESGNFSAEELTFEQSNIKVQYGNASFTDIKTDLNLKNESGNAKLNHTKGKVMISSNYGNLSIDDQKGNVDVKTNSGKMTLSNIDGDVNVKGEYSNVNINNSKGNLSVELVSGNFIGTEITLINQALMKSDYGNITLKTTNNLDELNCKIQSTDGTASINKNGVSIKKSDEQIVLEKGKILVSANTNAGNIKIE